MKVSELDSHEVETLRQDLMLRERQLKAVHDISGALFARGDMDVLLRESLDVLLSTVDADAGSILLYDPDRKKLVFRHAVGSAAPKLLGLEVDPQDPNGKAAKVYREGITLITVSTSLEKHDRSIDEKTGYHTESIITVPLKQMDGSTIGVLQALNKRQGLFSSDDQEVLEIIGSLVAVSIVNRTLAQEAQLAAVARAVGDLGHDIKNSLTPIETTLDTTIDAFVLPMFEDIDKVCDAQKATQPKLVDDLNNAIIPLREWYPEAQVAIKDGCADIREMVSEIADYVKGVQATNIVDNNITDAVEDCLRRLRVVALNRRVTIHTDIEPNIPNFPFDRRLFRRALYNLVNNALSAISDAVKRKALDIPIGGFNIQVRVSISPQNIDGKGEGALCMIEVIDDGPGIPPHVKSTLFTPNTISTTPGGTGIGTRFIKSVADAHEGSVGVESELGKGSRFWMCLPMGRNR